MTVFEVNIQKFPKLEKILIKKEKSPSALQCSVVFFFGNGAPPKLRSRSSTDLVKLKYLELW